jgi:hypothetical protein
MKNNSVLKTYVLIGLVFLIFSCCDLFSPKKNIVGNYYLVEGDTKDNQSICYKTEGIV